MNTEVINKVVDAPEASQLITLKPEKYVAEVFGPFKKILAKAIRESAGAEYDIATTIGMKRATELRATFRKIRLDAEKARKERKAPLLEIGKLLDSKYGVLELEIKPHEDKYDAEIKAEEARKEAEKERKLAEERARVEAIENRIQLIRNVPLQSANESSESLRAISAMWSEHVLDPDDFAEHLEDAIAAVNATIVELEKMRLRAVDREQAEARAASERAELLRLKAEKEAADKKAAEEAAARAEEERKRQEEERAKQVEAEAAAAAQAKRIADLEAQLAAMAELEAQRAIAGKTPTVYFIDEPAEPIAAAPEPAPAEPFNITGQRYSATTFRDDGQPILLNEDGSRSIFCDVDEEAVEPVAEVSSMRPYLKEACEAIDAALFSDDILYQDKQGTELKYYVDRWMRAISEHEAANTTTL